MNFQFTKGTFLITLHIFLHNIHDIQFYLHVNSWKVKCVKLTSSEYNQWKLPKISKIRSSISFPFLGMYDYIPNRIKKSNTSLQNTVRDPIIQNVVTSMVLVTRQRGNIDNDHVRIKQVHAVQSVTHSMQGFHSMVTLERVFNSEC